MASSPGHVDIALSESHEIPPEVMTVVGHKMSEEDIGNYTISLSNGYAVVGASSDDDDEYSGGIGDIILQEGSDPDPWGPDLTLLDTSIATDPGTLQTDDDSRVANEIPQQVHDGEDCHEVPKQVHDDTHDPPEQVHDGEDSSEVLKQVHDGEDVNEANGATTGTHQPESEERITEACSNNVPIIDNDPPETGLSVIWRREYLKDFLPDWTLEEVWRESWTGTKCYLTTKWNQWISILDTKANGSTVLVAILSVLLLLVMMCYWILWKKYEELKLQMEHATSHAKMNPAVPNTVAAAMSALWDEILRSAENIRYS